MKRVPIFYYLMKGAAVVVLVLFFSIKSAAQDDKIYTVKNGNMYIVLKKKIKLSELDEFISQFDLSHLALKRLLLTGYQDSINISGWKIETNNKDELVIFKPLFPADDVSFNELMQRTVFNTNSSGYNRFRNKKQFAVRDSTVRFFLRNAVNARKAMLAGNFNQWNPESIPMIKTDSGWIADVKLHPGKYWYKFIINDVWKIDEDNLNAENDGLGNTNSVFYVTNRVFRLKGFNNANKVLLSGSFNNWDEKETLMIKTPEGWELPVFLSEGTHTYRFIVDNKWISDPANPEFLPNEFNETNSVVRIGTPTLFQLQGYENARMVVLSGSFNNWRDDELYMKKTSSGWELSHVLGGGNYEYKFIVDGKTVPDPKAEKTANGNSLLILKPNYTFRVSGFQNARTVFLAGNFNRWDPRSIQMKKENGEWIAPVHLSPGKQLYKLIIDGKWMLDPGNKLWEHNEHETGNSVLWFPEN